jgi:hypothetical protein
MKTNWAIITGASAGIGWATAEELAQAGYSLILLARRGDRLRELQTKLREQPKNSPAAQFEIFEVDITDQNQLQAWALNSASLLKQVTLLVNNAGLAQGTEKIQDANVADWDTMIDTNVKAMLYLTRLVLPFMMANKTGHIVNLGSVAGRLVYPGGAVYCATKFAVRAISDGLRMDLAGTGIRVTNIEPGMVNTEFSLVRLKDSEKAEKVYEGMTPLSAKDIAETIAWCVQRPSHVNIQEVVIYPTDQASVGQVVRRS